MSPGHVLTDAVAEDPIAVALAFAIRRAIARRAAAEAERRRTMTVVEGGKRGGQAA